MAENECVVVCVTGQKSCERLISTGHELALERSAELRVVHVAGDASWVLGKGLEEAQALDYLFRVASNHGASMDVIRSKDVRKTLVDFAAKVQATLIVMGQAADGRDMARELRLRLPAVEFHVVRTNEMGR